MPKLEQWEIDLRKQLQGRSFKAVKETWEDQLQEDIQDVPDAPRPRRRRQANNANTLTYLATLLLLSVVTLFAYDHKTHALRDMLVGKMTPEQVQVGSMTPPVTSKYYDAEIKSIRTDLKRVEDDFTTKTKWNNERIALIGMLMNENFLVLHNGADKSQYLFFNRDWTISGMPHQLQLSAEDKAYLQKYVKPQ